LVPLIVTEVPTGPNAGERLVIPGVTVKLTVLLADPATVTITGEEPIPRLLGTTNVTALLLHVAGVIARPAIVTVLLPWVAPKFVPVIVTVVPVGPDEGERLLIPGVTLKFTLLLGSPATVTITGAFPRPRLTGTGTLTTVLLQLLGVTVTPPTVTVLVFCVAPKLVPVMVIVAPTGPDVGESEVIPGATLKLAPGLDKPLTVTTTVVFPAARPLGTGATMPVGLQLVGVVTTPPNVTVLLP